MVRWVEPSRHHLKYFIEQKNNLGYTTHITQKFSSKFLSYKNARKSKFIGRFSTHGGAISVAKV